MMGAVALFSFELGSANTCQRPFHLGLQSANILHGQGDVFTHRQSKFGRQVGLGLCKYLRLNHPIELRFGNEIRDTDTRIKSSISISPRARFGGYFNEVINAKPGDMLRIIKVVNDNSLPFWIVWLLF